jgi:hypothetical protein
VADSAELIADDLALQLQLMGVLHVLPLATAADPEVRAPRVDPVLRCLNHSDDPAHEDAGALAVDLDLDGLAGDTVVHKDRAFAVMGDGATFERHVTEPEGDAFGRIDRGGAVFP